MDLTFPSNSIVYSLAFLVTIDYVESVFEPRTNSGYIIAQSGLNGVTAFIISVFLMALYRRLRKA